MVGTCIYNFILCGSQCVHPCLHHVLVTIATKAGHFLVTIVASGWPPATPMSQFMIGYGMRIIPSPSFSSVCLGLSSTSNLQPSSPNSMLQVRNWQFRRLTLALQTENISYLCLMSRNFNVDLNFGIFRKNFHISCRTVVLHKNFC